MVCVALTVEVLVWPHRGWGMLGVSGTNVSREIAGDVGTVGTVWASVGLFPRVSPHVTPQEGGVVGTSEITRTNGTSGHARPRVGGDQAQQPCPRCQQPLQQQEGSQSHQLRSLKKPKARTLSIKSRSNGEATVS